MFNESFRVLYEYAIDLNGILSGFVEMKNIEFAVLFQQVVFQGRDKSKSDSIYDKTLLVDGGGRGGGGGKYLCSN